MRHVFTILYVLCALFIAGHSTQTLEPLASTAPAEAPVVRIASVAACVTGKLGPLIYPSVYANIQRQILAPLGRPNVDAFGAFELQNRTSNDEAVLSMVDAVNFLAWVPYAAQTNSEPCNRQAFPRVKGAWKSNAYGMAECARLVRAEESKRGVRYTWVLRLRSDLAYARALPPLSAWPWVAPRGSSNGSTAPAVIWTPGRTDVKTKPCVLDSIAVMTRAAMPLYFDAMLDAWNRCRFGAVSTAHRGRVECLLGSVLERGRAILPRSSLQLGTVVVKLEVMKLLSSWWSECESAPSDTCRRSVCSNHHEKLSATRDGPRSCDVLARASNERGEKFERIFDGGVQDATCCGGGGSGGGGRADRRARQESTESVGKEEGGEGDERLLPPGFHVKISAEKVVALCLSGHTRTMVFPEVWGNIRHALINPLGGRVDTFAALHMQSAEGVARFRVDLALSGLGVTEERLSWYTSDNISPAACQTRGHKAIARMDRKSRLRLSNPMSQAWGNLQCAKLVRGAEKTARLGVPYTWVVRARPDVALGFRLPALQQWPAVGLEKRAIIWAPAGRQKMMEEEEEEEDEERKAAVRSTSPTSPTSSRSSRSGHKYACVSDRLAIMNRRGMDVYYNEVFAAWQGCRFPKKARLHNSPECLLGLILGRAGATVVLPPPSSSKSLKSLKSSKSWPPSAANDNATTFMRVILPHVAPKFFGCGYGRTWKCAGRCGGLVRSNADDRDIAEACALFEASSLRGDDALRYPLSDPEIRGDDDAGSRSRRRRMLLMRTGNFSSEGYLSGS